MNEFIIRKGYISLEDSQITGSLSVTNSVTASFFTGSYRGDGSQLTGIEGFPFTGSAGITGSLTVVGPVNATTFTGDGSQLTGIEGFPFTGSAKITGSLEVTGSVSATTFIGDGSQLTGIDDPTPITATINNTNSPFTITSQSIVIIDSTNGDVTVNLPDLDLIDGTPDQKPILLYKNDYSQNVIYVQPSGSQLVNGTTQDIIVSIQIAIAYNPTSAGWVTEGTSYQSLAELELFFVPRTETGSFATTGSNQFSGSQTITGSLNVSGGITGSVSSASYVEYVNVANKPALVSGSAQVVYSGLTGVPVGIVSGSAQVAGFGIFATTGSNQFNGSQAITGSLTVTGAIVAQTLNVQQVTSSVVFSSGSNVFGNSLGNTQQFTGSVGVTGSLTVTTNGVELQVTNTGVNLGNALTDSHIISGSLRVNPNGLFVSGSGIVGIGTTTPTNPLHIQSNTLSQLNVTALSGNTNAQINLEPTGTGIALIGPANNVDLAFRTNATTRMLISGSGNVGIGTILPSERFEVNTGQGARAGMALTGEYPYLRFNVSSSSANARNWALNATNAEPGDFAILQSTAKDGNPVTAGTPILGFSRTGAATFTGTTGNRVTLYNSGNNSGINGLLIDSDIYPGITFNNRVGNVGGGKIVYNTYATGYGSASLNGSILLQADNAMQFSSGGDNVRMTIRNTGQVGLGTTTPERQFVISNGGADGIEFTQIGGQITEIITYNRSTAAYTPLQFESSGYTFNRGRVQIGGTTHVFIDHITNTARFFGGSSTNTFALGAASTIYYQGDASQFYPTVDNARSIGLSSFRYTAIWAVNGTIQTSDEREKTEITTSDLGLDFITKLRPVSYKWKVGQNIETTETTIDEEGNEQTTTTVTPRAGLRTHYGLIAQEVKEILGNKDFGGYIHDQETDTKGLRYDQFVPLLIKAIQEQQSLIESLKSRIEILEQ